MLTRPLLATALLAATVPTPAGAAPAERLAGTVTAVTVALKTPKKTRDKRAGDAATAPFSIFVPKGLTTVRGVVLNPFYEKASGQGHWRTAAAHWGFAVMGANLFGVRPPDLREVVLGGLEAAAGATGHPEIAHAPLCLVGMSAGGGMSVNIASVMPERVIAAAPVCLEVGPKGEASLAIPMVTIFGERDGKQMEKLAAKLPALRAEGARWATAVQWGRRHEFHLANNLILPFFDAAIRSRYPSGADPTAGPVQLAAHPDNGTWFGHVDGWGEVPAAILPWVKVPADFDAGRAGWLPDVDTAHVWQAFVVKRPRLKIKSPPGLGAGQPLVIHRAGEPVEVELEIADADRLGLESLAIHLGARRAASGGADERTFTLPPLPPGIHSLIAVGTDADGRRHLSHPNTILVR